MDTNYRDNISYIVGQLQQGGVILCPSDTIWGLSCDATSERGVARLREIKQLPDDRTLVVLVNSLEMARQYTREVHPRIQTLLEFHARPLTVIYPEGRGVVSSIMSKDAEIAIRVCRDPFCEDLIRALDRPIVSTSANLHGKPFPRTFQEIDQSIKKAVDYIVLHRQLDQTPQEPSVIARLTDQEELEIIRS